MWTAHVLAILALAHITSAFYAYMPEWKCTLNDDCVSSKRSESSAVTITAAKRNDFTVPLKQRVPRPETNRIDSVNLLATRLKRKFNSGTSVHVLEKRFNIEIASAPSQTNSAGIDQDGTDYSYFAEIRLGTRTQPYYMLLDTGAGQTWIMGSGCDSTPCTTHTTFGASDSTTYKAVDKTFSIQYGTGEVSGSFATDTLSIAGLDVDMTFGVANVTSDEFSSFPIDGILGLSQMTADEPNFIQALVASKKLTSNIFGVALSRASDGTNNGEINFGAVDSTRFSGTLSYTSVSTNAEQDWAIPMDAIGAGTTKSSVASGTLAYIDTGTTFVFAAPAAMKLFHATISGATSTDGSTYTVPCSTTDSAFVTFSGVTYKISPEDYISPEVNGVCTSNFYGIEVVSGAWLLGDVFLKNVYAVFDVDKNRLGLAARTGGSTASSSTASSFTGGPSLTPTPISSTGIQASTSVSGSGSSTSSSIDSSTGSSTGSTTLTDTKSNTRTTGSSTGTASKATGTSSISVTSVAPGMNGHQTSIPSASGSALADSTATSTSSPTATSDKKSGSHQLTTGLFGAILAFIVAPLIT